MRVLAVGNMYPPHHLGGYELCWRGAMRELRRQGHEARVLTTDYRRPGVGASETEDPDVHRELRWYWRDHEWLSIGPLDRLKLERYNGAVFDRHLDRWRPDVLTWWAVGGMSLGLLERGRRRGLPALLFVHDYWPDYGPEHDLWTRMWRWRPRAAQLAERLTGLPTRPNLAAVGRWLFNSKSMRDETLAIGLPISDMGVLSPGIELEYLRAPRERERPPWRWRMLYLGRVVPQKGVRTAIESLPQLPAEATLRIVGEGDASYRRELDDLAQALGVANRVRFEPAQPRDRLFGTYRAADVLVFPVQWPEPFGLVPLEAMALGVPVLATGKGGSADYLEDRRNSLLFEAGDPASLAAAVRQLAGDQRMREQVRAGGYETAAEHGEDRFNQQAVAEMVAAATRTSTQR